MIGRILLSVLLIHSPALDLRAQILSPIAFGTATVSGGVVPSFVQANSAFHVNPSDTTMAITFPSNVTAGNLVWVVSETDRQGNVAVSLVTGCGATWFFIDRIFNATYGSSMEMWWATVGTSGACTVTITSASATRNLVAIEEDTGLPAGFTLDQHTTAGSVTVTNSAGPLTTTRAKSMLIVAFISGGPGLAGAGYVAHVPMSNNDFLTLESRGVTTTGSYVGDWQTSPSNPGVIVFATIGHN